MFFLRYFLSCGKLCSTVFAVRISGVTFFCTSCFFYISYFCVLMSSCWNLFFITVIIIFTCIKHNSTLCASSFFLYSRNIIMLMIFIYCNLKRITFTPIFMFIPSIYMCIIYPKLIIIITNSYMINIFSIF